MSSMLCSPGVPPGTPPNSKDIHVSVIKPSRCSCLCCYSDGVKADISFILYLSPTPSHQHHTRPRGLARGEVADMTVIHAIETQVIEWIHQVRAVLKKDSSEALLEDRNPTPHTELLFWKNRSASGLLGHGPMTCPQVWCDLAVTRPFENLSVMTSQCDG